MKHIYLFSILSLLFLITACSDNEPVDIEIPNQIELPKDPLTIQQINDQINSHLEKTGTFDWSQADIHLLWSAVVQGNNILTLGYGDEGQSFSENNDPILESKKNDLLKIISENEGLDLSDLVLSEYEIINAFDVEITNVETIQALFNNDNVRYLEPNGYNQYTKYGLERSSSGCDKTGTYINPSHYATTTPNNAQVSWHFYQHNIPQAWNTSTGAGITIGLIDTGVSQSQSLLNTTGFNDGLSSGRFVQKYGTFIDSGGWWSSNYDGPHDKCGHGTAMASTMAAPRNDNGMPVGVAYNSNLVAYRATEDVLLDDYHERKGVTQALTDLARRSDVKIISMSIGYIWSIGNIKDAVRYAYSKDKMIFAAGGTSTSFTNGFGVIFPATMSETIAVTGVDDGVSYERCDTCHSGSKIDFTIIMEGEADSDKAPPVLGFYNGERRYTGGSSVATATTAGIAALIWSKYPSWSRSQVLSRLKSSSEFYPYRDGAFGYGNIDALQAVQ